MYRIFKYPVDGHRNMCCVVKMTAQQVDKTYFLPNIVASAGSIMYWSVGR